MATEDKKGNNPQGIKGQKPLDIFAENYEKWEGWVSWRKKGSRNVWNRDYIFTLIDFYPRKGYWLFGGVFEVLERLDDSYKIEEVELYKKYTGRVILSFHRKRGMERRDYLLDEYINDFSVEQILEEEYSGEAFPGYEKINHNLKMLEPIFRKSRSDWENALSSVKGVYIITDASNGKHYIGSAYGDSGIWSRWACYIGTGHGGNDELTRLILKNGICKNAKDAREYRKNFRFSILEVMLKNVSDDDIKKRETFWKDLLHTRECGYNEN